MLSSGTYVGYERYYVAGAFKDKTPLMYVGVQICATRCTYPQIPRETRLRHGILLLRTGAPDLDAN